MVAHSRTGQYVIEFPLTGWTSPLREHVVRVTVQTLGTPAIGDLPADIDIQRKGGGTADLNTQANQIWSYFRLIYDDAITATGYSLWRWVSNNAKDFISAGTLTTPAGSAAGSPAVASQATLTFRTAQGTIAKLVFIESNSSGDTIGALVPNPAGSAVQRIAAYMLSADSPMIGLDNSFVVAANRVAYGQNESAWRRVWRP